ncbi:MAG: hypothetical protein WA040_20875 [Anaerolineae bacterium]
MNHVEINEFACHMSAILQRVNGGEMVMLTSDGVSVALMVAPAEAQALARQRLAELRATAWVGDLLAPLGETWDAEAPDG